MPDRGSSVLRDMVHAGHFGQMLLGCIMLDKRIRLEAYGNVSMHLQTPLRTAPLQRDAHAHENQPSRTKAAADERVTDYCFEGADEAADGAGGGEA